MVGYNIHGNIQGNLEMSREIKQGDSLNPLLFMLIMEIN